LDAVIAPFCKIATMPNYIFAASQIITNLGDYDVISMARSAMSAIPNFDEAVARFKTEAVRRLPSQLLQLKSQAPESFNDRILHKLALQTLFGGVSGGRLEVRKTSFFADNVDSVSVDEESCPGTCGNGDGGSFIMMGEVGAVMAQIT